MSPEILERLRSWQRLPASNLLSILLQHRSGLDASDTGTGKTYISAAIASSLREPTLVICPKIARSAWERAAKHFNDSFSIINYELLRTGNTQYGRWSGNNLRPTVFFKCEVCQRVVDLDKFEPCPYNPRGIHCLQTKKRPADYGTFSFHPGIKNIILDEVHRCGGLDSLNADLLIAAKRQNIRTTGLSATPASSPLGMKALGYLLDLHNGDTDLMAQTKFGHTRIRPNFYRWASKFGCRRDPRFRGFKWFAGAAQQQEIMREIRAQIIPVRGIRLSTDDIPGFPEVDIQAELYTLDSPELVDSAYQEMAPALAELEVRAAEDKAPDSPLTKILRGRQQVELLKVPIFTELGEDYLAKGYSVVFFVNFRQTIDELFKRFPESRIIDGQTPDRDEAVEYFQVNAIRSLIVNCEAGGVALSLQDLIGGFPRAGLVSPNFSAVSMRQIFGRLPRDGGKSKSIYRVIFADKTVEMPIYRAVVPKLNNIDALTDSDLTPQNLQFS